jgi:hypothetical protein
MDCLKNLMQKLFSLNQSKSLEEFWNIQTFEVNDSLLCCCSDKFVEINSNKSEIINQISNEYLNYFNSFMKLLKSNLFYFQNFPFGSVCWFM